MRQHTLPIGDGTLRIHNNADISVGLSDTNVCNLCHILGTVTEYGLCRMGNKVDTEHPDEEHNKQ